MALAACDLDLKTRSATAAFPQEFNCLEVGPRVRSPEGVSGDSTNGLHGGKQTREFQPILSDVRELLGRMSSEQEDAPGQWTAARLKQTLNRYLHGEKVIILANREPYIHQRKENGEIEILHPASGLVTALEPVMRACSGVWGCSRKRKCRS